MARNNTQGVRQPVPTSPPARFLERVRAGVVSLAIEHENLEDKIYDRMRALIVGRQILPGERILVDQLAAEMQVSRTPVLNALKRLAQERVVEFFPRRGIYVRRFTKREMAELFAVREVLEGLAARLAAARMERMEVERLRESFRRVSPHLKGAAIRRYVDQDRSFHSRLAEIAGNEQLSAAMNSVNMMLFAWQDGLVRPPNESIAEHLAILEALGRRDPVASEAAMRLHVHRSLERLQREAAEEEREAGDDGRRSARAAERR